MKPLKFIANFILPQYISKALFKLVIYEGHFYVRRKVDLMKTAEVNAYIMHIFGKIELLSIHAT